MRTLVLLLALGLGSAGPVEHLDSALEDAYDAALTGEWSSAVKLAKKAEAAVAQAPLAPEVRAAATQAIARLQSALQAHQADAAARAANDGSWALVAALEHEQSVAGLAQLDPRLRNVQLAIRARDSATAVKEASELRRDVEALSCGGPERLRTLEEVDALTAGLHSGSGALPPALASVDAAIDRLEARCIRGAPKASAKP